MLKKLKKKDKNRAVVCLSINKTKTMDTLSCTRASNAVARIGIYCNEKRYQCAVCVSSLGPPNSQLHRFLFETLYKHQV